MKPRTCLIYNFAQHYRTNIFTLMDKELSIDFVFGDTYLDVKKMDYSLLQNFKYEVKNIIILKKPIYYQKGVLKLLFKNYTSFLILGESICVSTWLMLILSKLFNKKVYLWSHGWYGRESFLRKKAKKIFFSMASGIFLYGNYAKNLMIKEGFDLKKLHIIYNSLSYDIQIEIRNKLQTIDIYKQTFNNNFKNLIFIGRLTKIKRLDLLLKALKSLIEKGEYFNLTIIGDGETKDELQKLVNKFGLNENVWFYGETYNENELSDLIYNADLCVSPGNVGLTAIHSMTYGTPVLTHNDFSLQMPEFEAIENEVTGCFFNYNDADSLANSIIEWFHKKKHREETRKNCFKIVDERYNPHKQAETFKQVIT